MKKIEIFLRKLLLKLLLLIVSSNKMTKPAEIEDKSKVLFIRLNRIGDALVTTPLLKLLKEKKDLHITILADRKNQFIFENSELVDKVIVFEKGFNGILNFRNFTKEENIDVIVDLHDDVSTTVSFLIWLGFAKYKFGLKKENSKLYTHTIKKSDPSTTHIIERVMAFSRLFNLSYDKNEVNVVSNATEFDKTYAKKFIKEKFGNNKFLIGINISAGSEARFWGVDRFKELLNLLGSYEVNPLILCEPKDVKTAEEISGARFVVFQSQSFNKFSGMISQLDLLFTPDTSIVHIASAFKVPVFGLYVKYKTKDMIWSPYKSDFDAVVTEEKDFLNLDFEKVKTKFLQFFERIYNERKNS